MHRVPALLTTPPRIKMGSESPRKRPSLSVDDDPPMKRQRAESSNTTRPVEISIADLGTFPVAEIQDEYHVNRAGLQRSIGLALQHVGFDCASQDALESFTLMTETCQLLCARWCKQAFSTVV